ncbi:hypothetical protein VDG09_08685 [Xanthomonas campestris pv. raphani]|uniref:hypothetical protein n=1 Tax=Xanthomonas campestris TaxID=339 RepID=UPI0023586954|nr:hypothetical protein [Xanthomonas campestris]MDC8746828.1 hypothetical protein [Xanthomonas campestris]MEA9827728.1 hypothetical protein [Xanthomonas campestris pv. raphani]
MQISASQINNSELAAFGREAANLLLANDTSALAAKFGYAVACGRDPASAIKQELSESLSELGAIALALGPATVEPVVKYFAPNETCLLALVQCFVPTDNGSKVLLELIVTGNEHATHITLEQVSSAA